MLWGLGKEECTMTTMPLLLALAALLVTAQGDTGSGASRAGAAHCSAELRAAMQRMHEAIAHIPAAPDADEDFVRLMIPHHQAALDMAKTQLLCGQDPQVRRVAQEIITDQQSEIDLMQRWLKNHTAAVSKQDNAHEKHEEGIRQ
jgi:uncharacterized protein (DUF305 family)